MFNSVAFMNEVRSFTHRYSLLTSVTLDRICSVLYISEEDFERLGPNY